MTRKVLQLTSIIPSYIVYNRRKNLNKTEANIEISSKQHSPHSDGEGEQKEFYLY